MAELQRSPTATYEHQRPDGRMLEVRRSQTPDGGLLMVYADTTTHTQATQELWAFQSVVDSITDMVGVMDLQGCYRVVNDAWCHATGLARAQVLGRTAHQVVPTAVSSAQREGFERCLATRQPQVVDAMVELPGRGMRDLETTYHPYSDDTQAMQGVVMVTRDLTERRAQERRVHESERFVATIANNIPGMMAYWTRDLRCAFANPQYQPWFGLSPAQMLGISMQELMGEALFASSEPHIRAVLRGENQQFERRMVKFNGEVGYVWAQYIADLVDGEVRGFYVLVADITALKQGQRDLEAVNNALRISAIAFEGQEGIAVTDAEHRVLKVNSAFTHITGFAAGDMVGRPALHLAANRHASGFTTGILQSAQDTGSWRGELWCTHADGHDFPVSLTATAVADARGHIANYVITYIDITDRYHRDEQRRASEAAQRAALVREVHHRIKNNLQGITGLLQLFGNAHPQTLDAVNQAISQVKSIATIHGLQGQSATGIVLLCDLVRAIAQQVGEVWKVGLNTCVAPDCEGASIAEEETVPVALVLNELLLNAVKHADPLHPGVHIDLRAGHGHASIQILIANHGSLQRQSQHNLLAGAGQHLMASLMPSTGAELSTVQEGDKVLTLLELGAPVITVPEQNPHREHHADDKYPVGR